MSDTAWLRLYHEITRDRKLRRHPAYVRWTWIAVLVMGGASPIRGSILLSDDEPATIEDIADEAALSEEEVEKAISIFIKQKQIEIVNGVYYIVNWGKRQYTSDCSTERVRRLRERQKNENETEMKRFRNRFETPPDTDTDTEYREEKNNSCVTSPKKSSEEKIPVPRSSTLYSPHYEEWWKTYPKQINKKGGWKNYERCIKEGVTAEQLLTAAANYAGFCRTQNTEIRFILLPSTFLGPDKRFEDFLDGEKVKAMTKPVQDINARHGVGKPKDFKGGIQKL